MPFPIHPHMLRHACGFKLANDGHDTRALQHYLGHKNIQAAIASTIWSSVIALTPPACSSFISLGTKSAQIFM